MRVTRALSLRRSNFSDVRSYYRRAEEIKFDERTVVLEDFKGERSRMSKLRHGGTQI